MSKASSIITRFYHYQQNNSGGDFHFDLDKGITHHVVIEAFSPDDANQRAKNIGIYFNGIEKNIDCECCGDRWSDHYSDEFSTELPMIYGLPVSNFSSLTYWMPPGKEISVHYLDGTVRWYGENIKTKRKI